MRSFWEKSGVLGPVYRLMEKGLKDDDIAARLNLSVETVQGCINWLIHFLKLNNRRELELYAATGT